MKYILIPTHFPTLEMAGEEGGVMKFRIVGIRIIFRLFSLVAVELKNTRLD